MSHVMNVMLVMAGIMAMATMPPLGIILFIAAASSEAGRRARQSSRRPNPINRQAQIQAQQARRQAERIRAYSAF